jgi:hypothetical protein
MKQQTYKLRSSLRKSSQLQPDGWQQLVVISTMGVEQAQPEKLVRKGQKWPMPARFVEGLPWLTNDVL